MRSRNRIQLQTLHSIHSRTYNIPYMLLISLCGACQFLKTEGRISNCSVHTYTYTNIYSIIWQKSEKTLESLDSTPMIILICNLVVSLKRHHILYIIASLQPNPINISDERWATRDNNCRYISQTLLI